MVPPSARKPKRALKWEHVKRCASWALSFYETEEDARAAYAGLVESIGETVHREIGTHLARWPIRASDGLRTITDDTGHFDLHEAATVNFSGRMTIVAALT